MTKEETWATLVRLGVVVGKPTKTRWDLHGANLSEANLRGADLSEADLVGAYLSEADLSLANLRGADLSGADLTEADLHEAELARADLSGVHLSRADLSLADLSEVNLVEAYLSEVNLVEANLVGADLSLAYLSGANLNGAQLRGADLRGADLNGANLSEADLRRADLTDATLTASVLIKTDLTKANLSGACIDNASISEWVIKDVTCSHIIQAKSGKQVRIEFEPLEFEKEYAQIGKTAELILSIPLTESAGFIANAIAGSINHIKKVPVLSWKGVEALADGDTKITFTIVDPDFYQYQKGPFETIFKEALNDYFRNNPPEDTCDHSLGPVGDAAGQVSTMRKAMPVPLMPLESDTLALQKKASGFFLRMRKTGEDILRIATSVFG